MGGRGVYVSDNNTQIKMAEYLQRLEINSIKDKWDAYRAENYGGSGGNIGSQMLRKRCACCRQYTLPAFTDYEVCPVCGWIDDPEQNLNITSVAGRNPISLQEARQKWAEQHDAEN